MDRLALRVIIGCGAIALCALDLPAQDKPLPPSARPTTPPIEPRIPGRGKRKNPNDRKPPPAATGMMKAMMRRSEDGLLITQAEDKRVIRFHTSKFTKYVKKGTPMAAADLKPGDHLLVEWAPDEEGNWVAVSVEFLQEGTPEERELASQNDGLLYAQLDPDTPKKPSGDEPPKIKRKDTPAAEEKKAPDEARKEAAAPAAEPAEAESTRPTTVVLKHEETLEAESRPVTRRGKPQMVASRGPGPEPEPEPAPAASGPVIEVSDDGKAETPKLDADGKPDPILAKAKAAADEYIETLPNFICTQITTRYLSSTHKTDWHAQDILSVDLIYEHGKERYQNLKIGGKATKKTMDETGGAWSTGEFATVLRALFSPGAAAEFRYRRQDTIVGRSSYQYSYNVQQPNSTWTVHSPAQSFRPAFKGFVWIDRETSQILRIEMAATKLPAEFTFDVVETTVDYDYVRLSGKSFLVPARSEILSCERGSSNCTRNVIEFRNYRRFAAESTLDLK